MHGIPGYTVKRFKFDSAHPSKPKLCSRIDAQIPENQNV